MDFFFIDLKIHSMASGLNIRLLSIVLFCIGCVLEKVFRSTIHATGFLFLIENFIKFKTFFKSLSDFITMNLISNN